MLDTVNLLAEIEVLNRRLENAVEVVRCKECKYWRSNTQFCAKWSYGGFISQRTLPNDFCSCGEREGE